MPQTLQLKLSQNKTPQIPVRVKKSTFYSAKLVLTPLPRLLTGSLKRRCLSGIRNAEIENKERSWTGCEEK